MKPLLYALLLPGLASAAILPDTVGAYHRTATTTKPAIADRAVWDEFGLKNSESATYENGKAKFTATAWQLQDSTGVAGGLRLAAPAGAKPSKGGPLAAETAGDCCWSTATTCWRSRATGRPRRNSIVAAALSTWTRRRCPSCPAICPRKG